MITQFFAGREAELERLAALSEEAFTGTARIAFITGEAGMGKTALAQELLRIVQEKRGDVVAACGKCTVSEASYLPFRTMLEQLLGNERELRDSSGKLKKVMELAFETVWTVGPDLIGVFGLPIKTLQVLADKMGWRTKKDAPAVNLPQDLDPHQIYGWYTKIMQEISAKFPLLLFLDDLHWADESSINLLFHLGRELEQHKIFLVASYRPYEAGKRLAEIKTSLERYGAEELALDLSAEENAAEINAFVHSFLHEKYQTNFSASFATLLVEHTRGNALFLAELLKNMEEKGQIVRSSQVDGAAQWQLAGTVADIAVLPKKIEAVLRERVERLDKNLHDILVCASVQGDEFFAQAVAKAQQADCGCLIDLLDEQLAQEHQLIVDHGGKDLPNGTRVHAFSFRHNLLREYVYGRISKTKKEYLHAKMGAELEEIYQTEQDKIAGILAGHFLAGHVLPKAVSYFLKAAQNANERYGSAEAVRCARMGLEALAEWRQVLSEQEHAEHKVRLLIELANAEEYGGDPQEEKDHIQAGITLLEENLPIAEQVEEELQADFYAQLGRLYDRKGGKPYEAKRWFDNALVLYEHLGKKNQAAEIYNFLGDICIFIPSSCETIPIKQSISMLKKGFSLAKETQNFSLQSRILSRLTWKIGNKDFSAAEKYSQEALKLSRYSQDTIAEIRALVAIAYIYRRYAKQKTSIACLEDALDLSKRIGNLVSASEILNDIGFDCSSYMSLKEDGKYFLEQSMEIKERIGSKKIASISNLGWIFAEQGKWKEAKCCWIEAIAQSSERSQSGYEHNIGILYTLQERYKEAEEKFIIRIKILDKYKSPSHLVYLRAAQNYAKLKNENESMRMLNFSFDLFQEETNQKDKSTYLRIYAETLRILRDCKTAKAACEKSLGWLLTNAEEPDDYQPIAQSRLIMGKILVDMQSFQEAVPYLEKAKAAFAVGKHYALGETMLYLAKAHQGLGRREQAEELLLKALTEFQRLGLRLKEAEAKKLLGLAA